jgi:succinate dehydrogenase / fumarate reductase cytochrome b subunit
VKYLMSAIGRKQVMALTGLIWSGFVLTHMAANMLIIFSPEAYNKYSHALISNPLIYIAEAALAMTILGHIVNGIWLTIDNRKAKAQKSSMSPSGGKAPRFQSKWMVYHGTLIAVFIIYHLITFKYGTYYSITYPVGGEMRDLHRLVIEVFQSPAYVAFYLVCMVAVGLHLSHGFYSSFATLGLYHPRYSPLLSKFGYVYGLIIAAGFIVQPLYVFFLAGK